MEKRKPHYDLKSIQAEFVSIQALRMTKTARNCALGLGMTLQDVVDLIQRVTRRQFYKSMTSQANHTIWQDVYHVPFEDLLLYLKFTVTEAGYLVISLKEKE